MKLKIILIMLLVAAMSIVPGCLWADASTKSALNMSAITIAEVNRRCQAGDCNACKDGLTRATLMVNNIASLANGGQGVDANGI